MSSDANTAAACSFCNQQTDKHFKVRVFLDVDNTLYRYEDTQFHEQMHENIAKIFEESFPHLEPSKVIAISNEYHGKYGLSIAGLARHHHTEEKPFDLAQHCRSANSCDYTRLERSDAIITMLEAMKDEDGYDLWLFTNADEPHAVSCVEGIGIKHLFHESDGYFKCVDCIDQWGASPLQEITNKPFVEAYQLADSKAQARYKIENDFVRVMVDDAFANMIEPTKLGWVTVWVAHGRDLPADAPVKPTLVIERVEELRDALKRLFTSEKEAPSV